MSAMKEKIRQNHYQTCQFELEYCGQGRCEGYYPKCDIRQHKENKCRSRPFLKKSKSEQLMSQKE